jgi:hypothetical protein
LLDAHALSALHDKRGRLLPKLFKRRLELDFRNPPLDAKRGAGLSKICCCKWCGQLYHYAAAPLLVCSLAPVAVGFRGDVRSRHAPQLDWSLTECVSRLHRHGMGWEDIYWLLWGVSHVFYCRTTHGHFMAADYSRRRYHPQPASLPLSGDTRSSLTGLGAVYACCHSGPGALGCCFGKFAVDDGRGAVAYSMGGAHKLEPFHVATATALLASSEDAAPVLSPRTFQVARALLEQQQEQFARSSQHTAVLQEAAGVMRAQESETATGVQGSEDVVFVIPCAPTPNQLPPPWPPPPSEARAAEGVLRRALAAATRAHERCTRQMLTLALRRWLHVS